MPNTWINAAGGNFGSGFNWSTGHAPVTGGTADANVSLSDVSVGGTIVNDGTMTFAPGQGLRLKSIPTHSSTMA